MKKSSFKYLLILFVFAKVSFSQSNTSLIKNKSFIVLESKTQLSESDNQKVETANYDEYRFYNLRKKIQITRGPLIELLSVKELEAQGIVLPKATLDLVKLKSESFKHETISPVNLGFGVSHISGRE